MKRRFSAISDDSMGVGDVKRGLFPGPLLSIDWARNDVLFYYILLLLAPLFAHMREVDCARSALCIAPIWVYMGAIRDDFVAILRCY